MTGHDHRKAPAGRAPPAGMTAVARRGGFRPAARVLRAQIDAPLAKRGFARATLLTDWERVVGAGLAAMCRPVRLSHAAAEGLGGTLTVGVKGARALETQHLVPQIVERVNAHYGYRAVARVRLSQIGPEAFAAMRARPGMAPPPEAAARAVRRGVAPVADEGLRGALERLGLNVAAASRAKDKDEETRR